MKRQYRLFEEAAIEDTVLKWISYGHTKSKAAKAAGIHRTTLFRWLERKPDFSKAFAAAWKEAAQQRDYLNWLHHPFRGKRPPAAKRTRDFPRYGKPR